MPNEHVDILNMQHHWSTEQHLIKDNYISIAVRDTLTVVFQKGWELLINSVTWIFPSRSSGWKITGLTAMTLINIVGCQKHMLA